MYLSHQLVNTEEDDYFFANFDYSDLDQYTPKLPKGEEMSIAQLRQFFRNVGGIESGEIVPVSHYERGVGQIASHRERVQSGDTRMGNVSAAGNRAVVMYDQNGNVYMRIFDQNMNPTRVVPIGRVSREGLPENKQQRAIEMERRVRNRVVEVTNIPFQQQTLRGPDLRRASSDNRQLSFPFMTGSQQRNRQATSNRSGRQPLRPNVVRTRQPVSGRRNNRINRFEETDAFFDNLIDDYLLG